MLSFLNDLNTKQATDAERAFLGLLEGGCQVPIGVHADVKVKTFALKQSLLPWTAALFCVIQ